MTEPSTSWQFDTIRTPGDRRTGRGPTCSWPPGKQVHAEGTGNGLDRRRLRLDLTGHRGGGATIAFRAYAVGSGSEADRPVELEVECRGRRVVVTASSTDVVEAAGRAFLAAINQHGSKA